MITDPTTLLALALCIGILGLVVLILPLLILFWSQMEPQLVGIRSTDGAGDHEDEYASQAALPRLMKSFGQIAELEKEAAKKPRRKPAAKAKSKTKPKAKKAATTSRSKASATSKTVKAAPSKAKKATAAKTSKPKAKSTSKSTPKTKASGTAKKATAKKVSAKKVTTKKASATRKRTPAGAKRDPILGVVYSKKPKEVDDLKEIKGVAKVIEAKLHKAGVYTYRQIVEWDAAAIDAFSDKLAFKGRIRNEDWQKQCSKLHKSKYGEKIS